VRELRNLIENALIASGGRELTAAHFRLPVPASAPPNETETVAKITAELPPNLDAAERVLIRRAVAQANGNIAEAARLLGVHRTRIYRVLAE